MREPSPIWGRDRLVAPYWRLPDLSWYVAKSSRARAIRSRSRMPFLGTRTRDSSHWILWRMNMSTFRRFTLILALAPAALVGCGGGECSPSSAESAALSASEQTAAPSA